MAEFPYRREKSNLFGMMYRPIASIHFIVNGNEIIQFMYVDSGADITLIPKSVGELLGFEAGDEIKEIYSVSGHKISVIIKNIDLRIGRHQFNARVAWSLQEDVPLLLGRLDIFDRFLIIFDESNKKTIFKWKK